MIKKTLAVGCNYHTTWQSHKSMRFILVRIKGNLAYMKTRNTLKKFWTPIESLIFITTSYNIRKAKYILQTKLHGMKHYTADVAPDGCPECGSETDYFKLGNLNVHDCPNCKLEYKVELI